VAALPTRRVLLGDLSAWAQNSGGGSRLGVGAVHTVEDRGKTDEIGHRLQQGDALAHERDAAQGERDEQCDDEGDPDPDHQPWYLEAPALAQSATICRASAGSTTVATPGMLAISRLRPW